ncbi:hypothetical protein [Duganella sp. FT27W]|uniref:hypothetical protein n=1 Tax=Duganella sp. FT27W TaxID=2654636 RepID=UPI00128BB9C1|nr:hypothetical protein [Duganella sp. FT27W]MPQ58636.1 hypothetical protein [Duganella sp. FT27W]
MAAAPTSLSSIWGSEMASAFSVITRSLLDRGFSGPTTWKHKFSIPYIKNISPTARVVLGVKRYAFDGTHADFDCSAVILSKTIFDNQLSDAPWKTGHEVTEKAFVGYVPCLTLELSHFKWAEQACQRRPGWRMSEDTGIVENIGQFIADFDRLFMPVFAAMKTDLELLQAIEKLEVEVPPACVKSRVLFFGAMTARKAALRRGIA